MKKRTCRVWIASTARAQYVTARTYRGLVKALGYDPSEYYVVRAGTGKIKERSFIKEGDENRLELHKKYRRVKPLKKSKRR